MTLLALEQVSKSYPDGRRETTVLNDVSLEVDAGDLIGIWGMRRAGKSTLLQIAAGREHPDRGTVYFAGENITRMSPDRRARLQRHGGIGLLGTDWSPERNKPVLEHVALPLLSDGLSLREAREPAWRALERVGAAGCAYMPAGRVSHGERIRVALAQILVHEPRVLLVDEPAGLLRPSEGVELYQLLRALGRDSQLAIVIASEDVAPIRKTRRMFSIDVGKLRAMDQPGTLVPFPDRLQARQRSQP
jgi:predicted ABC-type transport system involved in lysophospholipase L1 biosynthesis ATPase subunit